MSWEEAIADFDRDLRARGSAERTRRAYGIDLGQFAEWAQERGLVPGDLRYRDVRRYGAGLSSAGSAPATVARKLAAIRGLFDLLVRSEQLAHNPADLVSSPKKAEKLPRVLSQEQMRSLLEQIPARRPLELRDRAMLELAYSCGLRCEEIVNLNRGALDHETEQLRVLGKGSKERLLPVGEPAQDALRRYMERGRHALTADPRERALFLSKSGRRLFELRRHPSSRHLDPGSGDRRRRLPARPASLICHPPLGGRRRPAYHPRAARPLLHLHHPGLHPSRRFPPARHLRRHPPTRLNPKTPAQP